MSYSQDEQISGLTSLTPTIDDVVVSMDIGDSWIAKKTTFQAIRDLFKTYFDTVYQATLVSATNIKTINSNSLLGSGNIALPVLSDANYTDATVSWSGTVITINNDVVTNAKQANMATQTFKWRTTAWTGDPEDLTVTQATAMLNEATTSLKGLLSASDKTKLDWLSNEWTLDKSGSFTAWGTYASGTLTTYDEYKIEIQGTTTAGSAVIRMRHNGSSSAIYSKLSQSTSGSFSNSTWQTEIELFTTWLGLGYIYNAVLFLDRLTWTMRWDAEVGFDWTFNSSYMVKGFSGLSVTAVSLSLCTAISWNIKIYWRNY